MIIIEGLQETVSGEGGSWWPQCLFVESRADYAVDLEGLEVGTQTGGRRWTTCASETFCGRGESGKRCEWTTRSMGSAKPLCGFAPVLTGTNWHR